MLNRLLSSAPATSSAPYSFQLSSEISRRTFAAQCESSKLAGTRNGRHPLKVGAKSYPIALDKPCELGWRREGRPFDKELGGPIQLEDDIDDCLLPLLVRSAVAVRALVAQSSGLIDKAVGAPRFDVNASETT